MTDSVKRIGLIHPPLVCRREDKSVIVCGWKRIEACLILKIKEIPVVYSEEKSDLKLFQTALFENIAFRNLDYLGIAEAVLRLIRFGRTEDDVIKTIFPMLGVPTTYEYLDLYLNIARCSHDVKREVFQAGFSIDAARLLMRFEEDDRMVLARIVSPLGRNKQKQILEDILDIAHRDGKDVQHILKEKEAAEVLQSSTLSSSQKAEHLRKYLGKKRYPALTEKEAKFRSRVKSLKWPADVTIQPEPYFEEKDLHVSFSFKNRKEFLHIVKNLEKISQDDNFDSLIDK